MRYPFLVPVGISFALSGVLAAADSLGAPPAVRVGLALVGMVVLVGAWIHQRGRNLWRRRRVARSADPQRRIRADA
jgi:hypothetical protein